MSTTLANARNAPSRVVGFDQALLWVTVALLAWGLVMVYSASIAMPENPRFAKYTHTYFLTRHLMWLALSFVAALLAFNTVSAFAQGTGFSSTDLKTGISNSLAVIMMFGFVLGISSVIYGGFAIRRGDVDQGKMSIIGGAIIAAAPAVVYAFYKIFGLDSNSAVGVGTF